MELSQIPDYTIENYVQVGEFDREFDLDSLASSIENTEYDPQHYTGLIYSTSKSHATVLLFRTGKIISTGGESKEDAEKGVEEFLYALKKNGISYSLSELNMSAENIVCTTQYENELELNAVVVGLGFECTEYEPEQFPGVIYRPEDKRGVALLFPSGNAIITGPKTKSEIKELVEHVTEQLAGFELI